MVTARGQQLGWILLKKGIVSEKQIEEALGAQKQRPDKRIGQLLIEKGACSRDQVVEALAEQQGLEHVNLETVTPAPEALSKITASLAMTYGLIPVSFERGVLKVAMADPLNLEALDDLRFRCGCEVVGLVSDEEAVTKAIKKHYGDNAASVQDIVEQMPEDGNYDALATDDETVNYAALEEMSRQSTIVELLDRILFQSIKAQAADIHFEPYEDYYRVRYRVDGVLYELARPSKALAEALSARIKVVAQLNIAERRVPQDGKISLHVKGKPIDLRVSTLPTMFGESVVIRILDRSVVSLDLSNVGMTEKELKLFRGLLDKPNGIVLVTGPTGSGKTTTLYSALNEINSPEIKIITTEDPVEYDLPGVIQVPVNEEIGVTYAACLRSILRQDPDVILVGEIRDIETAGIAVEASLTGHLVLSTLHTNDAPTSINRLIDLGLEPFLIAATLEGILAQRLVRLICTHCKTPYRPTEEMLLELELKPGEVADKTFYFGRKCEMCNNFGFKGRTAIYEIMIATSELRELILEKKSTALIRQLARQQGMSTLRESGLLKIFDGLTTIEEIVRETIVS